MFISVNKKIVYSLLLFLLVLIGIFVGLFINFYLDQLQSTKQSVYMRNKYVVSLLQENVTLQNELANMGRANPEFTPRINLKNIDDTQKQLTQAQKLNEELRRNYYDNRDAIKTGAEIIILSLGVVILFIILLLIMLDYWIVRPIERLTSISNKVSQGDYSSRLDLTQSSLLRDEFDILNRTFNNMIEKTENNIADIKRREFFLQQLIDTIPDGIRVIDSKGNVIIANKAFYSLLNLKKNCTGQKCHSAYGYDEDMCPAGKFTCPLRYLSKNKNEYLRTIHEVNKKPLYVNAAALKTNEGYIVEALHDLSTDVRFSHQQKISSLGFLSTSIAHEMKNNLGAIRLILETLIDSEIKNVDDEDSVKKYLKMAQKQIVEAIRTPERLLRLAQYSEQDVSDIHIESTVEDMIMMIDYDAKRHGIAVKTDIDRNINLRGNEADFKMIILNLMQNAIKAMPNGGELKIDGSQNRRFITLNIQDTGVGIEKDKIKRIFEPFYSGNAQARSSGLGLAIVRSLVEKFNGKIDVKSKLNHGTTFSLKFPVSQKKN